MARLGQDFGRIQFAHHVPLILFGQLKQLKRLQKENERLRKAVSDLTLDKQILAEAAKGNF